MVYSTRRFVLCLALCYFVLVFFSPFSIAIISLGEERASLNGAFRTFVRFALVWFCLFPLPLCVWEGLRLVIVALPGLFSYPFLFSLFCSVVSFPVTLILFGALGGFCSVVMASPKHCRIYIIFRCFERK